MSEKKRDINNTGMHAELETLVLQYDGVDIPVIRKSFSIHPDLIIEEVFEIYTRHRRELSEIYEIPKLRDVNIIERQLIVYEDLVKGVNGVDILKYGDPEHILFFTRGIFTPLIGLGMSKKAPQLPPELSDFPVSVMYDIKPDNYIISEGQIYPIDFFPPRVRDEKGLIQPYHKSLDQGEQEYLTYLYGDLVPLSTRFLFETLKVSVGSALYVAKELKIILSSSPFLYNLFMINIRKSKVSKAFARYDIDGLIYKVFEDEQ